MIRPYLAVPIILAMLTTARFFYHSMEPSKRVLLQSNTYSYDMNETQNCGEKEFDAREMRLRIDLVKKYTTRERSLSREAVVIFGLPDGLSEVLGNIISSDAKMFYLPKVLNKLSYYMKHEPTIGFPLATALIEDILNCNFEEKDLVYNLMQNKTRYLSRTLLRAPECITKERYRDTLNDDNRCVKEFSDWLTTECDESDQVFIQTDQLKSISSLQVLMTESKLRSLSIRVVHVVRDPRAVVHDVSTSVDKQLTFEILGLTSYRVCAQMLLNLKTGENPPPWLEGRYLLVKVEDVLNSPKRELEKLNEFLKRKNVQVLNPFAELESLFRVQKAEKWRSEMSSENVRLVEDQCGKVLALLGYTDRSRDF